MEQPTEINQNILEIKSFEILSAQNNDNQQAFIFTESWEELGPSKSKEQTKELELQREIEMMDQIFSKTIVYKPSSSFNLINTISSLATSIFFNYSSGELFNKESIHSKNNAYIFSKEIVNNSLFDIQKEAIMNRVLLMTYRQGFTNLLKYNSIIPRHCTDDSGWGCMIRSCQMLLTKAIIDFKIAEYFKEHPNEEHIPLENLQQIREDVLLLFYDNYVPFDKIEDKEDFAIYKQKIEENSKKNNESQKVLGVYGPYSIQVLCQVSDNTGVYSSDISIINSIIKINNYFFNEKIRPVYLYLTGGLIKIETLLKSFCIPYHNTNPESLKKEKYFFHSNNMNDYFENKNKADIFTFNNKEYLFVKKGVLFISLRLGLNEIETSYIDCLKIVLTNVKNNIGFVCGKGHYAYYFIGRTKHKLLYLDPHVCQKAVDPSIDNGDSYIVKKIFTVNFEKISSQMTFGFSFNKGQDILEFIQSVREILEYIKDNKKVFLTIE